MEGFAFVELAVDASAVLVVVEVAKQGDGFDDPPVFLDGSCTEDQDLQGECITLLTNAIITWNTVYTEAAIQYLTQTGTEIPDQHLAHLSPAIHKHINFYGRYDFTNPTPPPPGQLRLLRNP